MVARNAKGAIAPQKIVEDLFTHEQQAEMKTQLEEMAGTDLEDPLVWAKKPVYPFDGQTDRTTQEWASAR